MIATGVSVTGYLYILPALPPCRDLETRQPGPIDAGAQDCQDPVGYLPSVCGRLQILYGRDVQQSWWGRSASRLVPYGRF